MSGARTPSQVANAGAGTDREHLIRLWARKIAQSLRHLLPTKPVEAELRHTAEPMLDQFCLESGIPPLSHAEYSYASGIADAVFARSIDEHKVHKRLAELSMQARELAKTPASDKP